MIELIIGIMLLVVIVVALCTIERLKKEIKLRDGAITTLNREVNNLEKRLGNRNPVCNISTDWAFSNVSAPMKYEN